MQGLFIPAGPDRISNMKISKDERRSNSRPQRLSQPKLLNACSKVGEGSPARSDLSFWAPVSIYGHVPSPARPIHLGGHFFLPSLSRIFDRNSLNDGGGEGDQRSGEGLGKGRQKRLICHIGRRTLALDSFQFDCLVITTVLRNKKFRAADGLFRLVNWLAGPGRHDP